MKKIICLCLLCCGMVLQSPAQALLSGSEMFSRKKTSYITKKDGTELEGTITKIKRKKGLLESIAIETSRGKEYDLVPDDIAFMYLPPSGLDKFATGLDEAFTMDKWDRRDVEADLIKDGYVYFERALVTFKKKDQVLLMQLLNPGFSSRLKVFYDPWSNETAGFGVGGLTVAGGLEKSYYIQRGEEPAYKMKKKEYKKDFENFYKDCQAIYDEFGEKPAWPDFPKHVYYYSENCN